MPEPDNVLTEREQCKQLHDVLHTLLTYIDALPADAFELESNTLGIALNNLSSTYHCRWRQSPDRITWNDDGSRADA